MIDTDIITKNLSAYDVGKRLGLQPNRAGFCRCPIHGERTASMKLYREPGRGWYCFGCHSGGDVIRLASTCLKCDFNGAVAWLDAEYGLGLAEPKSPAERKEMRNRAHAARLDREKRDEAFRTADNLRVMFDVMAVHCQRVMEQTRPRDPRGTWDKRYFDAMETLTMCQDMSDRMAWLCTDIEDRNKDIDELTKRLSEYQNRLTFNVTLDDVISSGIRTDQSQNSQPRV